MNRSTVRQKLGRRLSWRADLDADSIDAYNDAINDAQKQLATDCPAAFIPDIEHIVLLKDRTHETMGRLLSTTADPYVLSFGTTGDEDPVTDGTWDGSYHLEVKATDGTIYRFQCREFWSVTALLGTTFYVSLDRPWAFGADTDMEFRLHQPEFFFTDDVVEVIDGAIWDTVAGQLIKLPEKFMRYYLQEDYRGNTNSRPEYLVRSRDFQMEAPLTAPVLSEYAQHNWAGPEPLGKFRAVYTYCWGYRTPKRSDPAGRLVPLWESAPSPVSNAVTISVDSSQLKISGLPNIDYMQDFDQSGGLRDGHSGWFKRIYLYRDSTITTGAFVDEVEARGVPVMLVDVDGTEVSYTWDGSVIPSYFTRLPEVSGYYAHRMVPHQDQDYEVDFTVHRRPRSLQHDGDAPRVRPDAEDMFLTLCVYFCSQVDNQQDRADKAWARYAGVPGVSAGLLYDYKGRHAAPSTIIPGTTWSPSIRRDPTNTPWRRGNYFKA